MGKVYCSYCRKTMESQPISKEEGFPVKGENIIVNTVVLECKGCGREIFDEDIDERNLELVYVEYRKKHKLLFPSQIKEIREKYGLSQRALGRLLEWGEITIHRYESGGLQDSVHNEVLQFIVEPDNMLKIYEQNSHLLSPHTKESLKERIDALMKEEVKPRFETSLEKYLLSDKDVGEFTGHKEFDFEKTKNMILYILNFHDTYRTKINKLLWYMDFSNFKHYSTSISGNTYTHCTYGPVPSDYELIIGAMLDEELISKDEVLKHGEVRELLKPSVRCDESMFSEEELRVMDFVLNKFKEFKCGALSEYSHKEAPYMKTVVGEKISYNLSDGLSLSIR